MSLDMGFSDIYLSQLTAEKDAIIKQLVSGKCKDYSEYKHFVGIIKGLNKADQILADEIHKLTTIQNFD